MKKLIDGLNEFYGENLRLVKTLMKRESPDEHPEELKWALQMIYFNGKDWVEICRIDNYLHEGRRGSHIHLYNVRIFHQSVTGGELRSLLSISCQKILSTKNHQSNDGHAAFRIPPVSDRWFFRKIGVKRVDMTFKEADKAIKEISTRILREEFGEHMQFEEEESR